MGDAIDARAEKILTFWLGDGYQQAPQNDSAAGKAQIWFRGGPEVDKLVTSSFSSDLEAAEAGKLDSWSSGYNGLAAVILMDQLSRNIYRGSAKTYAFDAKALALAKSIHEGGSAAKFPPVQKAWLYMPLMHSEDLQDLKLCVQRFEALRDEAQQLQGAEEIQKMLGFNIEFAVKHLDVVKQWGRYPHRNEILGRESTAEEIEGLASGKIPRF